MKVAVAGTGYVGLVSAVCLAEKGHTVACVDVDENKIKLMRNGVSPIYEKGLEELMHKNKDRLTYTLDYKKAYRDAEVILIGVGTPEQEDGSANLSYVRSVAKQIADSIEHDCVVVVKSTVPIGTNDKVEEFIKSNLKNDVKVYIASNPEFLAQGSAVHDTLKASRIVIGTEDEEARKIMEELYKPFNLPMLFTNRRSAEMIKYASNDFLALKISYINDIANLCELVGANIEDVTKGMSYDSRIGDKFLNAGIGYGGSCFPKDTKALYYLAKNQYDYELKTIKAAIDVNVTQKTKLFFEAKRKIDTFYKKNVTVLGATFKPGTDDLREAPSIDNVKLLLKEGADITVWDPVGLNNFEKMFGDKIQYESDIRKAIEKSDIIFIMTEWADVKKLDLNLFNGKVIYDGRNCFDLKDIKKYKFEYHYIGR